MYLVDESTYDFGKPVNIKIPVDPRHLRSGRRNRQHLDVAEAGTAAPATTTTSTATRATASFAANNSEKLPEFGTDEMKSFYLLTHQTKKLQSIGGVPADKYTFPATRSNEIGWWVLQNQKNKTTPNEAPGSLIDAKLGRWARGQGNVYKWWGGGPN